MNNHFNVPELLMSVAAQMRAALRESLIPHPGELGTGREEVIRGFLRKYLPQRFGVSTGFVFDFSGKVSKQIDVIIYDALLTPKFEVVGGKVFHPCESVVCVGEIKSVLTSKRDFTKALENLRSVKDLDRSSGGENISLRNGEVIDQRSNHLDQIFSFLLVVDRCMKEERLRVSWFEHLRESERHVWPNVFFYFDHYLITHCCKHGVCPNPMDATGISSITDRPVDELLIRFYQLISMAVEATNVSRFSFLTYLDKEGAYDGDVYPFESAPAAIVDSIPPHLRPIYGLLDKI